MGPKKTPKKAKAPPVNAVDVDDVSVDSPVVTESEGEDDFGSEGEQAEEVASEEESEEEIDGQFDADASESEDGEDDHDADEEESDEELGDMDEEALLQEIVALRGQMGDEVDEEDDDDVREGGERGMGRASTSGVQFQQQSDDDSSEDERENRNTVGNVPLKQWYKDEEHIGYDRDGNKLMKKERKDELDKFLARTDNKNEWRTVHDDYNDEDIVLSKEEMDMVKRIRRGHFPDVNIDPFPEYVDWMKYDDHIHPMSSAPEPKRRFVPSKWEAKKVVKLVRALRRGWIKMDKPKEEPKLYLMWADDVADMASDKTANGLSYIPPPKPKLPGHNESYNPAAEYVPTEEERAAYDMMDPTDKPDFIPQSFDAMRKVPAYAKYVQERFERCLDLYLCPRARKKRLNVDPESLLPKLPKPRDLQPFPTWQSLLFEGHTDKVYTLSVDPSGQWLASGSQDGTARLWEVATGRCRKVWELGAPVRSVAWCPNGALRLLAVAVESRLLLLPAGVGSAAVQEATRAALVRQEAAGVVVSGAGSMAEWGPWRDGGEEGAVQVTQKFPIRQVAWHHRGEYLATVAPTGGTQAVLVHQLSKQVTQNPFRKNKGRVAAVAFHPNKPFFFVATQHHVRVYNLAKQVLSKKLLAGTTSVSSLSIHPGGDNLVVGAADRKLAWFDMDLSNKPYKTITSHQKALQSVAFHRSHPLLASASDDGTVHVFHGMVYADLLQNPLIVPVKILRGHALHDHQGVLAVTFHPVQPWVFTAGADKTIRLFSN